MNLQPFAKYIFIILTCVFSLSTFSQTCQTIDLNLDSALPLAEADGIIKVCVGEAITLAGSATFSGSSAGAIYEWDLDDGNSINGTSATFSYPVPGVYIVTLNVNGTNPVRCTTSKNISQVIQVSTEPNFDKTEANDTVICFGESTTLFGGANSTNFDDSCTPPVGTQTSLPDGVGVPYETSVIVSCFDDGATVSSIDDIESICFNMEHSFIGDLHIDIVSPNGQTVRILSSLPNTTANLGIPWANGVRGDNTGNVTPGTGSEYCILPDDSLPTLIGGIVSGGTFPLSGGPGTYIDDYVPAGNYKSENSLTGLVGSPLNGQWRIRITDNIGGDNGTIFNWSIKFNPSILPVDYSFRPNIVSQSWDADPSIVSNSGNDVVVQPSTSGIHNYTYRAIDDFGCEYTKDVSVNVIRSIEVETEPLDVYMCDTNNDGEETFDFSSNESLVIGSQPASEVVVSYHLNEDDADRNIGAISYPYRSDQAVTAVWVRIADVTQTCYKTSSFNMNVIPVPIANTPTHYGICDNTSVGTDTDGLLSGFDLSTKINEVLGSQSASDYDVRFYPSQADADARNDANEIITTIQNSINPQPIFARIEHKQSTACYATTSFNLVVHPKPIVNSIVDLIQCDDDSDGVSPFNLSEANELISTDYINETFSYYETQAEADGGLVVNQITNFTAYPNATPLSDVVYARIETVNGCYRTAQIDLTVGVSQIPNTFTTIEYYECDTKEVDNDNTNGVATFDFSDAKSQIEALFPGGISVTFYNNEEDALAELNAIPDLANHRNEGYPNTQNIYVRVDSDTINACLGLGHHVTLVVDSLPEKNAISDYVLCSDTNEATFNLTTKDSEVRGTQTRPILISYHETEQDAINNIPITNPTGYASTSKTIYVRAQFDDNNNGVLDARECIRTDITIDLVVNPNPVLVQPTPIQICSDQVNTVYDLTIRFSEITNGDSSVVLSYFETPQDLLNNTPIATPESYFNTQLDRDIIVVATGVNGCTSTATLSLKTILYVNLNQNPLPIEECEVDNDGFDNFDIRRREAEILNGLPASDFEDFFYYELEADADLRNSNAIQSPGNFVNTVINTQTIYANVKPMGNDCWQVVPITLIVNPVPEIAIEEEYVICLSEASQSIPPELVTFLPNPPIDTQLNITEYSFQWYNDTQGLLENIIVGATDATYVPTAAGDYTVIATNRATGCTIPATTKVIGSYPPESITVELGSDAFSGNNILNVSVVGNGEYEYRIDYGEWQADNIFENLRGGERTVYVRDLYNCNEIFGTQIIIDYPKYFTPNGDGVNDTWNIRGISGQIEAKIYVYDRYGKLIKQLLPFQTGWNGTFNGRMMPTDDYWFTVEYTEPRDSAIRVFKAHFALKR